ncbi:CoA-binding protein [Campylobacter porcelli]|uniref:CoA-binding protein n=1 Tax=Campylobacter porcelli TaxID=1660073 RepID=A0ABU7M528_9BACT|nr:CoA-binding protein [Campylobacter sp. CX2-4855-23]
MQNILNSMKNIAVVGFSPDPSKASNHVGNYLIEQGFNVFAIYPKSVEINGRQTYQSLSQINQNIDTIVMFRKAEFATKLAKEAVKLGVKNLWLQLGIINDEAKQIAQNAGLNFVQDACIMIEHKRIKK